jgi:hypothetical protein
VTVRFAVRCARLIAAASLVASLDAAGFTFSDGTTARCTAAGRIVPETDVSQAEEKVLFTGKVVAEGGGYRMLWNMEKLNTLPAEMHDYLFFHECAHAQLPTRDETQANCAGLIEMRASGKAGPDIESKIAAFYGADNAYWIRTLQCANRGATDARQPTPPTAP